MSRTRTAFTLLELLVVVAVIGLLISILLPALGRARSVARQARTASDMHQMLLAYHTYTVENDGHLLLGFLPESTSWAVHDDKYDVTIAGHAAARYPWRFLPYIKDWRILFNNTPFPNETVIAYSYQLSLLPRFGLNSVYVGGDHGFGGFDSAGNPNTAGPAVFRDIQVRRPASLVVFAETACYSDRKPFQFPGSTLPANCPVEDLSQYFQLQPPQVPGKRIWSVQNSQLVVESPSILGVPQSLVSKKPIVGFFDGHAQAMGSQELGDPQIWSNQPQ